MEEVVVDGQGTRLLRGARWKSPAATAMLVPGPPSPDAGPHQEVGCLNPPPRFSYPLPSPWAHRLLSPESLVLACTRRHLWFWILLSGSVLGLQFLPARDILLASSTAVGLQAHTLTASEGSQTTFQGSFLKDPPRARGEP